MVTLIVDDMGIGVVFQQDLGDIDLIVIGRVNQWVFYCSIPAALRLRHVRRGDGGDPGRRRV